MATAGEPNDKITARSADVGMELAGDGVPGRVLRPRRPGHRHPGARERLDVRPDPARQGARAQRHAGVEPRAGLPLRRHARACGSTPIADLRAVVQFLTSDEGKADLKDLGGLSSATAGVILRELITFADQGADAVLRAAGVRHHRPAARRPPTAAASCRCSSCPGCRTGRSSSRRSSCGCSPTCSTTCPRSATSTSPSSSSSSTRRTCCSTTRARTSSTPSSRRCG